MKRRWLSLAVLLAGCGGAEPGTGPGTSAPTPPTLDASALELVQEQPGTQDRIVASPGATAHVEKVLVFGDAELTSNVASIGVAADGSFAEIRIGDNAHGEVWVLAESAAGRTEAVRLTNDILAPALTLTGGPADPTAEASAEFQLGCDETGCTLSCSLDGGAFEACTSPLRIDDLAEGEHLFRAVATDVVGNRSEEKSHAWTVDLTDPVVILDEEPAHQTNETHATFAFSCSEEACVFECSVDGDAYASCTSPVELDVEAGDHTFRARALLAGHAGQPTEWPWNVDVEAPVIALSNLPAARTASSREEIEFACDGGEVCTFTCSFDGAEPSPCTSGDRIDDIPHGPHTFEVTARDGAGNEATALHGWEVDLVGPTASFTSTPPALTSSDAAEFAFGCDEAGCTFTCAVDAAPTGPCNQAMSYTGLAEGFHVMELTATDDLGNVGATVRYEWERDVTPPVAQITSVEPWAGERNPVFEFECNETTCTFFCSLDGATPAACTSPTGYSGLPEGQHRFELFATDGAGNVGAVVSQSWEVDLTPPVVTLVNAPSGTTTDTEFEIGIVCNEPNCSFQCSFDGGRYLICVDPYSLSGVAPGNHTLDVVAYDLAGNVGSASASWTVTAP